MSEETKEEATQKIVWSKLVRTEHFLMRFILAKEIVERVTVYLYSGVLVEITTSKKGKVTETVIEELIEHPFFFNVPSDMLYTNSVTFGKLYERKHYPLELNESESADFEKQKKELEKTKAATLKKKKEAEEAAEAKKKEEAATAAAAAGGEKKS